MYLVLILTQKTMPNTRLDGLLSDINNLVFQWGCYNSNTTWVFPISFTHFVTVHVTLNTTGGSSSSGWYCHGYTTPSLTSVNVWNADSGQMSVLAIGY